MLLAGLRDAAVLKYWLACGGVDTLLSYGWLPGGRGRPGGLADLIPEPHWRSLAACLGYHETGTHLFSHANYLPDLPMEQQPAEALRWQYLDRRTARAHVSGKTAVVGHTPQRSGRVLDLGFVKGIDTSCEAGRWLTALEVGTGEVWQADRRGELKR
jgi:serine/threonine protein phosphatase 1